MLKLISLYANIQVIEVNECNQDNSSPDDKNDTITCLTCNPTENRTAVQSDDRSTTRPIVNAFDCSVHNEKNKRLVSHKPQSVTVSDGIKEECQFTQLAKFIGFTPIMDSKFIGSDPQTYSIFLKPSKPVNSTTGITA